MKLRVITFSGLKLLYPITFIALACILSTCPSEKKTFPSDLLAFEHCNISEECKEIKWHYTPIENPNAFSGNHTINEIEFSNQFDETHLDRNILLVIEGMYLSSDLKEKGKINIEIVSNDSVLFKQELSHQNKLKQAGIWTKIIDSCIITKNFISKDNKLKITFANKAISGDDFKVKMYDIHQYSFIPTVPALSEDSKGERSILSANEFYKIGYYSKNGELEILDKNNQAISKHISFCLQYEKNRDSNNLHTSYIDYFKLEKKQKDSLVFLSKNDSIELHLILYFDKTSNLKWRAIRKHKHTIYIEREALVFQMFDSVSEVYKNNRKNDQNNFQREYWLDKEGLKFGENDRTVYLYHCTNISSLQLNTCDKTLFVNLDLSNDHPLIHFPLNNSKIEIQKNLSAREVKANETLVNDFDITIGLEANSLPRFMKNKDGFLATYIFTEHADFTDINTQYAVNFGSEKINQYKNAIGGFAYYKIPVTKSVFYTNPTKQNNSKINPNFSTEICNIRGNQNFESFLNDLYQNGFEICLHSPEDRSSNRKTLEEALSYLQQKFNAKSWIDHGYSNSEEDNREDLVCDGLIPTSDFYALDLWRKHNTKYFWNCYNEHQWLFTQFKHKNSLNDVYHGWGDQLPQPDYWAQEKGIYSWPTNQHFSFSDPKYWQEIYNEESMKDLVYNQGTCINHCYPSSVGENSVYFTQNEKGEFTARKEFNDMLALLAKYENERLLNITTVKEYLDYRIALSQISYRIISNHKIEIYSPSKINGLSMIVDANTIKVNDKTTKSKKYGNEVIFWFNIEANETVSIEY